MSRNKYGAVRVEYNGVLYHSKKEAAFAEKLDLLKKRKEIKGWERQIRIPIVVNGDKICTYVMDFAVLTKEGVTQYWEIKGYETAVWKLKWKLLQSQLKGSGVELHLEK